MRFGLLVVALMSGVGIAGCWLFHRDVREWAGITLGEPPPKGAAPDALSFNHAMVVRTGEGFPWQDGARAQLDARGRVMAVTLQTACCGMLPSYYQPLSEEELAALRRKERAIPDRYRENVPPPGIDSIPTRDLQVTRYISWRDMIAYGKAAIRKVRERLGPPASIDRERRNVGSGLRISTARMYCMPTGSGPPARPLMPCWTSACLESVLRSLRRICLIPRSAVVAAGSI